MRLLDLFCCEGGAGVGYKRAGFDVVGVDIANQPRYPFAFVKGDAIAFLEGLDPSEWDAIHASPPCQDYSRSFKHMAAPQPQLIDPVRDLLDAIGLPYVIENVVGAPLARQDDLFGRQGISICGTALGLRVYRHRLFESNRPLQGTGCNHRYPAMNPHNTAGRERIYAEFGKQDPEKVWRKDMGVETNS